MENVLNVLDGIKNGVCVQMLPKEAEEVLDYVKELEKANRILEENWLAYMRINQDAIDILESIYMLDNVTITNNACEKIEAAISKLQGNEEDEIN